MTDQLTYTLNFEQYNAFLEAAAMLAALEDGDTIRGAMAQRIHTTAEKALTCRVKPTFRTAA
jgi:hypothetical protein